MGCGFPECCVEKESEDFSGPSKRQDGLGLKAGLRGRCQLCDLGKLLNLSKLRGW